MKGKANEEEEVTPPLEVEEDGSNGPLVRKRGSRKKENKKEKRW